MVQSPLPANATPLAPIERAEPRIGLDEAENTAFEDGCMASAILMPGGRSFACHGVALSSPERSCTVVATAISPNPNCNPTAIISHTFTSSLRFVVTPRSQGGHFYAAAVVK